MRRSAKGVRHGNEGLLQGVRHERYEPTGLMTNMRSPDTVGHTCTRADGHRVNWFGNAFNRLGWKLQGAVELCSSPLPCKMVQLSCIYVYTLSIEA